MRRRLPCLLLWFGSRGGPPRYPVPGSVEPDVTVSKVLEAFCKVASGGFESVVFYEPVLGFPVPVADKSLVGELVCG